MSSLSRLMARSDILLLIKSPLTLPKRETNCVAIFQNSKSNNLMTKTWKNKVVDSSNDILSVSPVSIISRSMKRRLLILNLILIHKILI